MYLMLASCLSLVKTADRNGKSTLFCFRYPNWCFIPSTVAGSRTLHMLWIFSPLFVSVMADSFTCTKHSQGT
jgi:thiosulfate reductase cytochrome b subunit